MALYEPLVIDTSVPEARAPGASDDYGFPKSVFLKEQASAAADASTYGQVWVKTGAPCTLWYTDEDGTDFQIGGVGFQAGDPSFVSESTRT